MDQVDKQYVSRGGIKLQKAIDDFRLRIKDTIVLDVGSSTGGFVDCLLQNGAAKVYSVDTAYGELAWKLRNNPKVVVMERTNILHLQQLPSSVILNKAKRREGSSSLADSSLIAQNDTSKVDLITIDASWTKLELILPVVQKFLKPGGTIIALLKPHYQANKKDLVKGVLPKEIAEQVKNEVLLKIENLTFKIVDAIESPILGGAGNQEYLLYLTIK